VLYGYKVLKDYKNVIIFSEPNNAGKIARHLRTQDYIVISFSIEGKLALKKYGIESCFPDDLVVLPDLDKVGTDNLRYVKDFCNIIDKRFKEKILFLKENDINIFYNSFFTIKVFFDNLITSYLILNELFREIGNRKVVIFKNRYSLAKIVEGKEALVPALIEHIFLNNNENIKIILNNRYCFHKLLFYEYGDIYRFIISFSSIFRQHKSLKKQKDCVLVMDYRYDVKNLINGVIGDTVFFKVFANRYFIAIRAVNSKGLSIKKVAISTDRKDFIHSLFKEIYYDSKHHELFRNDTELCSFAIKCLEAYFSKSLSYLVPYGGYIKRRLSSLGAKALFTSSCRLDFKDAFLIGIVRSLKIPVITYQEGGGAGYLDWPLFNFDTELSDFFLVYGKGVAKSRFIKKNNAEVVPVGSIYLDNLKRNIKKGLSLRSEIYVILDNIKTGTHQHYPYNNGFYSQAYRHQLNILNILKRFGDTHFVLKTLKEKEYLYLSFIDGDFIKMDTRPLSDILHTAGAFVLDYPSTVLQECLLTDRPIALLYSKEFARFEENAFESLKKRIRISSEPGRFYDTLDSLIGDVKHGNRMTMDNDFLQNYCLMNNPSQNVQRFFSSLLHNNK
jgi:hypothetical protein